MITLKMHQEQDFPYKALFLSMLLSDYSRTYCLPYLQTKWFLGTGGAPRSNLALQMQRNRYLSAET